MLDPGESFSSFKRTEEEALKKLNPAAEKVE